uniref:Uncharacterized protein n=1 Tax=Kalanchoe fedtschenkoi TaxID=63787 RepID=A0A7N0RA09_KALFE
MDSMEVKPVAEFCLRPSSPTPPHLRYLKLSLLDHLLPCPYATVVFFYTGDRRLNLEKRLEILRDSLSRALTKLYPLAGKVKDDHTVDCNDEGLRYLEAQVNCDISDFLRQPDLLAAHKFLPAVNTAISHVANVQVNVFKCGGMAIGLCISHKVLDGAGIGAFMNEWAAAARGEAGGPQPDFSLAAAFPAESLWLKEAAPRIWGPLFKPGNFITKRFVFESSSVAKIRQEASATCLSPDRPPTRIEAVSALIWKVFMHVRKENNNGVSNPSTLTHLVNLRPRAKAIIPAITDRSLGNMLWVAISEAVEEARPGLGILSEKVRAGIAKIDGGFVAKLRGADESEVRRHALGSLGGIADQGLDVIAFTSWCRLGFYEADFGWGRPVWVSSLGVQASVFFNVVLLVDTVDGEGVEAWVNLDEKDMEVFQRNADVRRLTSVDPSPLDHQVV